MMNPILSSFTPTQKGSLAAGIGLGGMIWFTIFDFDDVTKLLHINNYEYVPTSDKMLDWINEHKILSSLLFEFFNYWVHGITDPDSVTFAFGNTLVNSLMIFVINPVRIRILNRKRGGGMPEAIIIPAAG